MSGADRAGPPAGGAQQDVAPEAIAGGGDQGAMTDLLALMRRLRDPGRGCPWDLEQTFASIAPYTLEEAYEVVDAIEGGRPAKLRDELGDLLFQVVFHARMAEERGWFDFEGVARSIHDKLVRRHPHVFGGPAARPGAAELSAAWEAHKARERQAEVERGGETGTVDGAPAGAPADTLADVPRALPALLRAHKLSRRAAGVGFDWTDPRDVRAKVAEELAEVDEAVQAAHADPSGHAGGTIPGGGPVHGAGAGAGAGAPVPSAHVVEEVGDLLFAIANWSRHLRVDPEAALRAANAKFERRFAAMERLAARRGLVLTALSLPQWEDLWRESKALEAGNGRGASGADAGRPA